MTQPLEAVITSEQRQTFEIENFIFHIIQPQEDGDDVLILLDEVNLHEKQRKFFVDRLIEIAEGNQFVFKKETMHLRQRCMKLISNPSLFVDESKEIASEFSEWHNKSTSTGVFVVATVKYLASPHLWQKMVFLLKMDGQPSFTYSYKKVGNKLVAIVNDVPNALNEDKKAIQKWALIDTSGTHVWHVLAFDKINRTVGEYFKKFLGVVERQQDSTWTRVAHQSVRKWAKGIPFENLPLDEDCNTYTARALNYLRDNDTFDTDAFIKTVVRDSDRTRKRQFMSQLRAELETAGVAGQTFSPRPDSIPAKLKKSKYVTHEGISLEWTGDRESVGINFKNLSNGNTQITIETANVTPKG